MSDKIPSRLLFRRLSAAPIGLFLLLSLSYVQATANTPSRLALDPPVKRITVGETIELEGGLTDARGEAVEAPVDLSVIIEAQFESGRISTGDLDIKEGQKSAKFEFSGEEPGVMQVRLVHENLRDIGFLLEVVPESKDKKDLPPREKEAEEESAPLMPENTDESWEDSMVEHRYLELPLGDDAPDQEYAPPIGWEHDEGTILIDQAVPSTQTETHGVTYSLFWHSRSSEAWAGGEDAAIIEALIPGLGDDGLPKRMEMLLNVTSGGMLTPVPLAIPKGESRATARLSSSQVGQVEVEYLTAVPPMLKNVLPENRLLVEFRPPIDGLRLRVDPSSVSLVQRPRVIAEFVDNEGKVIATDQIRRVGLSIRKGTGAFEADQLTIAQGVEESRTWFIPKSTGQTTLIASSGLWRDSTSIAVTWPMALLLWTIIGGIIGGVLAVLRENIHGHAPMGVGKAAARAFIGAVSGPVFYFFSLLAVHNLTFNNPLHNEILAPVVAIIGGYMGTEVFHYVWTFLTKQRTEMGKPREFNSEMQDSREINPKVQDDDRK